MDYDIGLVEKANWIQSGGGKMVRNNWLQQNGKAQTIENGRPTHRKPGTRPTTTRPAAAPNSPGKR